MDYRPCCNPLNFPRLVDRVEGAQDQRPILDSICRVPSGTTSPHGLWAKSVEDMETGECSPQAFVSGQPRLSRGITTWRGAKHSLRFESPGEANPCAPTAPGGSSLWSTQSFHPPQRGRGPKWPLDLNSTFFPSQVPS